MMKAKRLFKIFLVFHQLYLFPGEEWKKQTKKIKQKNKFKKRLKMALFTPRGVIKECTRIYSV